MDLIEIPINNIKGTIYENTLKYNTEISKEYPEENISIFNRFYQNNLEM